MSAKASTQPGRRTPLSLSGTVTKTHPNKGAGNSGSSNANGHTTSNANKQDNKLQQSKTDQQQTVNSSDIKENPNKKQQQADKKQQQNDNIKKSNEKNQNGVNSNKQQANENKQQQNKDKQQQQNGNDNKASEKEKKEKSNKSDKLEKQQEKEEIKVKDDKKLEQDKPDIKKEDKKLKEVKEAKEDKKETLSTSDEKTEQQKVVQNDDTKSKEENQIKNADQNPEEKVENMEVVEEQQLQEKSSPVTPKTNSKANKNTTPLKKTPNKVGEKTPQKSSPSNSAVKTTPVTKRVVTTTIDDNDDIEMEPLAIESSPIKNSETEDVAHMNITPTATSTPGKILLPKRVATVPKFDVQLAMQTGLSPERPRVFSQISGRKSIRPISDYTPSKFQTNPQFRESYRRINTELDVTNTSMNVTVGSEVPNNLSFSFFGRGRKRDRTPPQHSQSAIGELQTDMEISPPKRARIDMHGFFSAVSSPLSLLRNRFSKATLQSSTPVKLQQKLNAAEDEIEVQNVSGVSVHEEIAKTDKEPAETSTSENDDNDATLGEEAKETKIQADIETPTADQGDSDVSLKCEKTCGIGQTYEQSDIKITETSLQPVVGDPMTKNKRCVVM